MIDQDAMLARLKLVRSDPWEFLHIVNTLDPIDRKNPIKKFPVHLDYLKFYTRVWQHKRKNLTWKSRRMKLSWINIALFLWEAMFYKGTHHAFVSKKEEDSNELVGRAAFIAEHLDHSVLPKQLFPRFEFTFNKLKFLDDMNSQILGFPSGADQLRQFTFSGILGDEMAFWDNAEKMYAAAFPTLEGGGRFTGISTPAPGFYEDLVFDRLDGTPGEVEHKIPMQGIEAWENKKNGFTVTQIHYSADPEKRSPAYIKSIKESMPLRKFLQEYELRSDTYEGLPVFPDFDPHLHGVSGPIKPHIGLPLLLGFDFGLTPACIVCQFQEGKLCALKEFVQFNMGARRFLEWMTPLLLTHYPSWQDRSRDYIVYIDPSGMFRKDTDEGSCAKEIDEAGFKKIIPGPVAWDERKNAVEHFLTRRTQSGPLFQVSTTGCPLLVRGFNGGYRYDDKVQDIEPEKLRPVKDDHSHIQDALQMVAARILKLRPTQRVSVPRMGYSFSHEINS